MTSTKNSVKTPGRRGLRRRLRRFLGREDGNSTIEFVIIFPIFMGLFIATFESGMVMVRQVMLDRGTDLAVRAMRLGSWANPNHEDLKKHICNLSGILPDCLDSLMIELRPIDTATYTPAAGQATCVDTTPGAIQPVVQPDYGAQNELMLVRVCAMMKPIIPTTGLGLTLHKQGEYYALTSTSAFVNEPRS